MRRISANLALITVFLASPLPATAVAAQERQVFVSVLDADGAPVTELAPRDLVVREDGVVREVLRVQRATHPLTIALLIDTSTAAETAVADLRRGVNAFLEGLDPKHEVALISFGERSTLLVDYTTDRQRLRQAAARLYPRTASGAYFLDAVVDASHGLQKREPERPVIVALVTEGVEFSNRTHTTVLPRLHESGATLHALVISTGTQASLLEQETLHRNMVLDEGTRTTGGRREQILSPISLPSQLTELAKHLQDEWVVTYSRPDALLPPERLQVEGTREGLRVRARTHLAAQRQP
jgi:VWFA-related protein